VLNLVSKNNSEGVGIKINLTFDEKDYLLKNWEIIDELGQSTFLEFTKIRKNISIGTDLFIIK
jgi:outer membrane lipoprotein-sorting protein